MLVHYNKSINYINKLNLIVKSKVLISWDRVSVLLMLPVPHDGTLTLRCVCVCRTNGHRISMTGLWLAFTLVTLKYCYRYNESLDVALFLWLVFCQNCNWIYFPHLQIASVCFVSTFVSTDELQIISDRKFDWCLEPAQTETRLTTHIFSSMSLQLCAVCLN